MDIISGRVAVLRLLGFVAWTLVLLPAYLVLLAMGSRRCIGYVVFYWRVALRLMGVRVVVHGAPDRRPPVLYVANHASYLDIGVLAALLPARFVAKTEVSTWPAFGFLSRITRTVFVDRKRGGSARERDALRKRLESGESLILFPEGTSNDGNRVLTFKSSLLAVAEAPIVDPITGLAPLPVQPVSIAYTRLDGLPMGRAFRNFYAWYGDMTMAGHLFALLGLGDVTVEVMFHPVVTLPQFADRKGLTNHCHDVVNRGVIRMLSGRVG